MQLLKKLVKSLTKTLATSVFKPKRSFKTLAIEEKYVLNYKPEDQERTIIDLRFGAWRKHNSMGYSKEGMRAARLAFHAGFRSSQLETGGE